MLRWCVTHEMYDNYGNQGIGTDVINANTIDEALKDVNDDLTALFKANMDQITCWRVIGINIMPEFKEGMGVSNDEE